MYVLHRLQTSHPVCRCAASQMCALIRATAIPFGKSELRVTGSAGVAAFPEDGETSEEILAKADKAMFRAKALGRDRVVCSAPASDNSND